MEALEALKIIKEVLDAANKSGLFANLESAIVVADAYKVLETELNKDNGAG
jgi:hypothetical protein